MNRTSSITLALLAALGAGPTALRGEGCLRRPTPPLRQQTLQSRLIFLAEAKPRDKVEGKPGDLRVLEVFKPHPALGRTRDLAARGGLDYVPIVAGPSRWLLFCDVGPKGELLVLRKLPDSPSRREYVKELVRLADEPARSLTHCLNYLDHADRELAEDAHLALSLADGQLLRDAARGFPAERVVGWLRNPKTPRSWLPAYALLLGSCGAPRHADPLRRLLNEPGWFQQVNGERLLAGFLLLRPQEGWPLVRRLLHDRADPSYSRDWAYRAVRFFWEERPDVLARADLLGAVVPLLHDSRFTERVVLDLRRWQRWEMTDLVLARWDRLPPDSHRSRRAILQFALRSPRPEAAAFLAHVRRTDPVAVRAAQAYFDPSRP